MQFLFSKWYMVHLVTPKIHSLQKKPTGFLCAAAPRRPTSFQETGMGGLGVQFSPTPLSHNGCPRLEMLAFAKCHKTEGQVQDSWKLNYMHFGMVWACWEILPCRAYSKTMRKTSCRPATPWLSNQPTEQPMYDFLQGKNYGKESLLSFLNFHSLTVQDLRTWARVEQGKHDHALCQCHLAQGSTIQRLEKMILTAEVLWSPASG